MNSFEKAGKVLAVTLKYIYEHIPSSCGFMVFSNKSAEFGYIFVNYTKKN